MSEKSEKDTFGKFFSSKAAYEVVLMLVRAKPVAEQIR